jgi:ribosomal protein S8
MLQLQRSGYINTVLIGGPTPPPPSPLAPIMSSNPEAAREASLGGGHVSWSSSEGDRGMLEGRDGGGVGGGSSGTAVEPVTQENISSRRLWVGLKYYNNRPVLEKMKLVSKPTRRVWMGVGDLEDLARGEKRGYVRGMRGVGEALFLTTDKGIMEIRECVERKVGGMLLCRINGVDF